MQDWVFQSTLLIALKFAVIGFIHTALFMVVMEGALKQKSNLLFMPITFMETAFPKRIHRGALAILIGLIVAGLGKLALDHLGVQTLLVVNAGFLTIWYVEAGLMLARGFFKRLLGHDLPQPMVTFVSFVLMVNAGYFTLMFIVSLMRSSTMV